MWLAEQVGVDQTSVSAWLRGDALPRADRFPAIERALGLPEGELMAALLGIDRQASSISVREAVEADRELSAAQKEVLIAMYEQLRGR